VLYHQGYFGNPDIITTHSRHGSVLLSCGGSAVAPPTEVKEGVTCILSPSNTPVLKRTGTTQYMLYVRHDTLVVAAGLPWLVLRALGHHSHRAVLEAAEQHLPLLLDAMNLMAASLIQQNNEEQVGTTACTPLRAPTPTTSSRAQCPQVCFFAFFCQSWPFPSAKLAAGYLAIPASDRLTVIVSIEE
jgi:hypothetical protein